MELASPALQGRPIKSSADRAIDLVHLSRMTFGDRALEREVLQLFIRQSEQILAKIESADADGLARLAHTLKGSAAGVGAWAVADAASALEQGAKAHNPEPAMARVRISVAEAAKLVEELLRAH